VAPGWVQTEMSAARCRPGGRAADCGGHSRGPRRARAEIAGPILFLCTPLAGFISGEVLNVNGARCWRGELARMKETKPMRRPSCECAVGLAVVLLAWPLAVRAQNSTQTASFRPLHAGREDEGAKNARQARACSTPWCRRWAARPGLTSRTWSAGQVAAFSTGARPRHHRVF